MLKKYKIYKIENMEKYSIYLRPFEQDDYILINKWRNDQKLQKYTIGTFRYVSSEIEKEWVHAKMINNVNEKYWSICLNQDPERMVGYTSLNEIDYVNRTAHAGGLVVGDKEYQDGVIAFEAVVMKLMYAFDELNLNRLTSRCLKEHPFTPYFLLALGYKYEGCRRKAVFKGGVYHDVLDFAILRSDYYEVMQECEYRIKDLVKKFTCFAKSSKSLPFMSDKR